MSPPPPASGPPSPPTGTAGGAVSPGAISPGASASHAGTLPVSTFDAAATALRWAAYAAALLAPAALRPWARLLAALHVAAHARGTTLALPLSAIAPLLPGPVVAALRASGAAIGVRLRIERRGGRLALVVSDDAVHGRAGRTVAYVPAALRARLAPYAGRGIEVRLGPRG